MACYLWKLKDGQPMREEVFAQDVANLLETQGYKANPEELIQGDLNDDGEVTNDEIRAAAKDAGIDKWDTARISNLKGKLGYED